MGDTWTIAKNMAERRSLRFAVSTWNLGGSATGAMADINAWLGIDGASDADIHFVALQEADEAMLTEPEKGYCVPGLSFTPQELFEEIRKHHPGFGYRVELDANMNKFANLWPDELSGAEPLRDLDGFIGACVIRDHDLVDHVERNLAVGALDRSGRVVRGHHDHDLLPVKQQALPVRGKRV